MTASVGLKISKDPKLQRYSDVHIRVSMQDAMSDERVHTANSATVSQLAHGYLVQAKLFTLTGGRRARFG